jgi:putative DNA primase/helicase
VKKDHDGAIEIYDRGRFFTFTGRPLNGSPLQIEEHQHDVERLYELVAGSKNGKPQPIADKIPHGTQHNTLVSLAGSMRRRGMGFEEIFAALKEVNWLRCEKPGPEENIRRIAESACRNWKPDPNADVLTAKRDSQRASEHPGSAVPPLLYQPYTDTGNGERLAALHGRDIRFCLETKKWLAYDGRRWKTEDNRRVKRLAKLTMRLMYAQAADVEKPDVREIAEKHARKSESAAAINAMLACAECEDGISVSAADCDRQPFLLNLLNGTMDLKTGELFAHRREDLITKLVHFNYEPTAECPLFLRFIYTIMGGSPEASEAENERAGRMVEYLPKCFGHALTGDVSEKAVFCFFDTKGKGNNGKTTLLEIIRFILSEYSAQVLIDSLMAHQSRESNASLSDLADLRAARFVTTSESEEGQRLAVAKLKYLTQGMGEIKTCRKYENPIKFPATHKMFIDSNHKPVIRGGEQAIWNRLKPIPFTVTISADQMDKGLLQKLKAEAEGILAWMIEGCRRWLSEGLGDPPEVTAASIAWQAESDRFPAFLMEKCIFTPDAWVAIAHLWPAYQNWCEVNGEKFTLAKTAFDERLSGLACHQGKRDNGAVRAWIGIRFRTQDDDREEAQRDNGTTRDTK